MRRAHTGSSGRITTWSLGARLDHLMAAQREFVRRLGFLRWLYVAIALASFLRSVPGATRKFPTGRVSRSYLFSASFDYATGADVT